MRDIRDRRKASATAPAAVLRAVGVGAALAMVLLVGLLAGGCVWIVAKRSGLGATELRRWPAQRALQTTGVTDRDSLLRKQADPNRLAALPVAVVAAAAAAAAIASWAETWAAEA